MTPAEAFAAICLAAVGCDGQLGKEEAQSLRRQLEFRTPYRQLSEQVMGEMFDGLLTILRRDGWAALIASAMPVLDCVQRQTVLALAAHLVRADREVQPIEAEFMEELARSVDLPEGRAQQILEVVELLHRDALA